jgi:uncharacterized membrane protein
MGKGRLEAFSDGVMAIMITIMVLEIKVPHGDALNDLRPLLPIFLSYILSFAYVGTYWNNNHHMLHATTMVTGAMLWSNLHLLFWLSSFPFGTGIIWRDLHQGCDPFWVNLYGVIRRPAWSRIWLKLWISFDGRLSSRLIPHRHRTRADLQPAHEL